MFIKKNHILIVDDDAELCSLLQDYLSKQNFKVSVVHDGLAMTSILRQSLFDLIILDVMLPGDDGLTLCKKVRSMSDVPIIILSAMGEDSDRIVGLEIGADDYLAKPFNPRELLARIKALMRRSQGDMAQSRKISSLSLLKFSNWYLDRNKRQLFTKDGIVIALSSGEYDLLLAFLENPERTLSRDQLLDITRGRSAGPFDRSIDVQVARIRKKIEVDPKKPKILLTVRGGGYQLDVEVMACSSDECNSEEK